MSRRQIGALIVLGFVSALVGNTALEATGNLEVVTLGGTAIGNRKWHANSFPIAWSFHDPTTISGCYSSTNAPVVDLQPAHVAGFATWVDDPLSSVTVTYAGITTVRNFGTDGVNLITFCDQGVLQMDPGFLARTPSTALTVQFTVTAGGGCPPGQGILDVNGNPPPAGFCFPAGTYPAGTTIDADIEYNTFGTNEEDFSTNNLAGTYDIQSTATHEMGHFFGLSHDPLLQAVMFPFIDDEPASDGAGGQRVLKESDSTSLGRYYPTAEFTTNRGSITGIITLDGSRADGVHVVAVDPNTLRTVAGRFSVSRFEDPNALGPEGADFAANGAGHYRIDGLEPGQYYVYVEYFDNSEFITTRLANRYNTTVLNSSVATGSAAGFLGFLPELPEFYNTGEALDGGNGISPGTADDNSDAAALVTVAAGVETSGIDIAINIEPPNGQAAADRENPTTRLVVPNDLAQGTDSLVGFGFNGGGDDFYAIRFPAGALPAVPFNVAEGLWSRAGIATQPMHVTLTFEDPNNPGRPDLDHPVVASAKRIVTGYNGGFTESGDFIDVRDQWNVTISQSQDLYIIVPQPDKPPGSGNFLTEGFYALAARTISNNCRVCRTLLTQDGGASYIDPLSADVLYDLIIEQDAPVMVTAASPSSLDEGMTADVLVNGFGFQFGADVDFGPDVVVNSVTYITPQQLRVNVSVNNTGATVARPVNVIVTNPEVVFPNVGRVFTITPIVDTDGDLVPDAQDCAPSDPSLKHPATEVTNLTLTDMGGGMVELSWDSQEALNGTGTSYDVVTGNPADLPIDGGYASATCAANDLGDTPFSTADPILGVNEIGYWLVKAVNGCNAGPGTYGDSTFVPDPRDGLDASPPCP